MTQIYDVVLYSNIVFWGAGGVVVKYRTPNQEVLGSNPTAGRHHVVSLKAHLLPEVLVIIQEVMALS